VLDDSQALGPWGVADRYPVSQRSQSEKATRHRMPR